MAIIDDKLSTYKQACRQGMDWILQYKRPDGAIGPVEDRIFYYRLPWTLSLMGELEAAHCFMDWISRHMMTVEGEFSGISPQGIFDTRYGSYPLACLIVGGTYLGRLDIVYPGVQALSHWQDEETGGVYNKKNQRTETEEQELFPTAQLGMTMLLAGRQKAAINAGHWMATLWEQQPDIDHKLYHVFKRKDGLVTQIAEDQMPLYITRKDHPWQHHFNGGIAAAFLTQLFMATGAPRWLNLARAYQNFSMTTNECQFQSMQTCKSGWGSGLLYVITREQIYQDWTIRMGDWFLEHQQPDGHWKNTHHWNPDPTLADNIEITTEFVMHLAHIIGYLSLSEGGMS